MQSNISRYSPSGALGPLTFVYTLGAMLGAALLAGLYMFLVDLIPFIYLNALIVLGFGFVVGLMGAAAVTGGHCRNRALGVVVGLLVGAAGLVASYGWGYLSALREAASSSGVSVSQLAQEVSIGRWLDLRLESGWEVRHAQITDIGVMVIWFIEAVLVIGIPLLLSMFAATEPYCEPCKAWTRSQTGSLKGVTREEVQPLLERGDLAGLLAMAEPQDTASAVHIQLQRIHCPNCSDTAYLTVHEVRTEIKDGKERESKVELLENAVLTRKLSTQYVDRFVTPAQDAVAVAGAAL